MGIEQGLHCFRLAFELLRQRTQPVLAPGDKSDAAAIGGQGAGQRLADPRGRARR